MECEEEMGGMKVGKEIKGQRVEGKKDAKR